MTDSHELSIFADQGLSDEQAQVLGLLAVGKSIEEACKLTGVTQYRYTQWMAQEPAFSGAAMSARRILVERQLHDIDSKLTSETDVNRLRIMVQHRQWLAARVLRKVYGYNLDITVSERVDLSGALAEARSRALRLRCDSDAPIDVEFEALPSVAAPQPPDNESSAPAEKPALPDIFS
jgi:hypothetical protein